jgi:hypothetical protein
MPCLPQGIFLPSARRRIFVVRRFVVKCAAFGAHAGPAGKFNQQIERPDNYCQNEQSWNEPDVQHSVSPENSTVQAGRNSALAANVRHFLRG